jgi:DhnA family fructose-bisphosphate aldolase class Ia
MGEMVPGGFDSPDYMRSAESIAIASRIGAELGSDWVKIPYAEGFEVVTASCYVPAVILGGAKKGSERSMLEKIRTALDVGSKGVAIGRNIFQADDPEAMTAAVAALIHRDISVDEAMKILKGS